VVGAAAVLFVALHWSDAYQWKPDSLFYEAQLLRVQGAEKDAALLKVFHGPLARPRVQEELRTTPPARRTVASDRWVRYSERFYDRRWTVPVLAAAVEPALGADALRGISLLGYVLAGLAIQAFLGLRFRPWIGAVTALGCLALQPLRYWSLLPLTDSFGVALEAAALACAVCALRRSWPWLVVLAGVMLALSFTRDSTIVVVAGLAWVAVRLRSRRAMTTLGVAVAASLPAPLLFGAPALDLVAYTLNGFQPVQGSKWHLIARRYLSGEHGLVHGDLIYLAHHPYVGLFAAGGLVGLFALRAGGDVAGALARGGVAGAVVLLLAAPNYTALRLELPFVPLAAYGAALAVAAGWASRPAAGPARASRS